MLHSKTSSDTRRVLTTLVQVIRPFVQESFLSLYASRDFEYEVLFCSILDILGGHLQAVHPLEQSTSLDAADHRAKRPEIVHPVVKAAGSLLLGPFLKVRQPLRDGGLHVRVENFLEEPRVLQPQRFALRDDLICQEPRPGLFVGDVDLNIIVIYNNSTLKYRSTVDRELACALVFCGILKAFQGLKGLRP